MVRRLKRRDVAAGYDRAAAGYDHRHDDARSRTRFRVIERPMLRATFGARHVLELGCGTGRLLSQVRAPVRVGIDISRAMLEHARTRLEHVILADAHALPFAAQAFDAILAGKGVFRYLDAAVALRECARVLAPNGVLAVHQYAARTWSMRGIWWGTRVSSAKDRSVAVNDIQSLEQLYQPARAAGLKPAKTHLWRSIRMRPYALPVPTWMPGQWWSHCVVLLVKR